jgi:glycosyltransferase involved in cell wall biosynthesis
MRVAHIRSSGGYYGADHSLLSLASAQRRAGLEPIIFVAQSEALQPFHLVGRARALGIEAYCLLSKRRIDPRALAHIARLARRTDVLHTHDYKANVLGLLGSLGSFAKRVATCHSWTFASGALRVYEWGDARVLRRFQRVVAVAPTVAAELQRAGVDNRRVVVIPNAIEEADLFGRIGSPPSRPSMATSPGTLAITAVGRLSPEKGHATLLQALARLRSEAALDGVTVTLVGDGPLRHALRDEIARLDLANVRLTGYVSDMANIYHASDIVVLPSLREGLPMVVLEAMAFGKAIAASRVGGVPTIVRDGVSARLFPPGAPAALARILGELIANAPSRKLLGENARRAFERWPRPADIAARYSDAYAEAIQAAS